MEAPFENVIIINEECHGFIGVARDVPSAINFLWQNNWLSGCTEIPIAHEWVSVESVYGKNWCEHFKKCTLDELQNIFDGCFYFHIQI